MYQQDWLMRQIQMMVQFIARLLFGKETIAYEIRDQEYLSQIDHLYHEIRKMLAAGEICQAEDLLFEKMDKNNQEYLRLAADFYQTLNGLSDEELENADFSREEIDSGLHEVMRLFGLPMPPVMRR